MRSAPIPSPSRPCPFCGAIVSAALTQGSCPKADRAVAAFTTFAEKVAADFAPRAREIADTITRTARALAAVDGPEVERIRPKNAKGRH